MMATRGYSLFLEVKDSKSDTEEEKRTAEGRGENTSETSSVFCSPRWVLDVGVISY